MLIVFACLLLAASVLVLGLSVRMNRRTTAEAIRSVGSYGYGAEPVVRDAYPAARRTWRSSARSPRSRGISRRTTTRAVSSCGWCRPGMYDVRPRGS